MLDRGPGGVRRRSFFGAVGDYVRTPIQGGIVETVESIASAVGAHVDIGLSARSMFQADLEVPAGTSVPVDWSPRAPSTLRVTATTDDSVTLALLISVAGDSRYQFVAPGGGAAVEGHRNYGGGDLVISVSHDGDHTVSVSIDADAS